MKASAAQRLCYRTIGARIEKLHAHLQKDVLGDATPASAWGHFQSRGNTKPLRLDAALVDYPKTAGTCDPVRLVSGEVAAMISDASVVFPRVPEGLDRFSTFHAGDRCEYLKLTVELLRCGKLRLRHSVLGGGTVFPVAKSDGINQREVWHGSRVSEAAARPPRPRLLASHSAFVALELSPNQLLRVSTRDGLFLF